MLTSHVIIIALLAHQVFAKTPSFKDVSSSTPNVVFRSTLESNPPLIKVPFAAALKSKRIESMLISKKPQEDFHIGLPFPTSSVSLMSQCLMNSSDCRLMDASFSDLCNFLRLSDDLKLSNMKNSAKVTIQYRIMEKNYHVSVLRELPVSLIDFIMNKYWILNAFSRFYCDVDSDRFVLSQLKRIRVTALGTFRQLAPCLDKVEEMDLSRSDLGNDFAEQLKQLNATLSSIKRLNLYSSKLNDKGLQKLLNIGRLPGLEFIHLGYNHLSNEAIQIMSNSSESLKNLKSLNIGANAKINEQGIEILVRSKFAQHLLELDLYSSKLTSKGAELIANSPNLSLLISLNLGFNKIGDEGLKALIESPYLKQIQHLHLFWAGITNMGVILMAQSSSFTRLKTLNLLYNMAIGIEGLEAIAHSKSLQTLEKLSISARHNERGCQIEGESFRVLQFKLAAFLQRSELTFSNKVESFDDVKTVKTVKSFDDVKSVKSFEGLKSSTCIEPFRSVVSNGGVKYALTMPVKANLRSEWNRNWLQNVKSRLRENVLECMGDEEAEYQLHENVSEEDFGLDENDLEEENIEEVPLIFESSDQDPVRETSEGSILLENAGLKFSANHLLVLFVNLLFLV